jgi:uncharacterized alpha-E superfamily protein
VESLLKTSESLIIFRRRSGSIMDVTGAVDLLVYDAANPRSLFYQLDRLVDHLTSLLKPSAGPRRDDGEQVVLRTTRMLRATDASRLAEADPETRCRVELDAVFGRVDEQLAQLLDGLRSTFFAHERLSVLAGGRDDPGRGP